jgi:hypothetical protein
MVIWYAIPRIVEGLGFQTEVQSAMTKSVAEGEGKLQVFLVDGWEEACGVEVIFCCQNLYTA